MFYVSYNSSTLVFLMQNKKPDVKPIQQKPDG
jgi:hypothetical protein